jgi:ABC-2 type transport system permease protein
MRKVAAISLLHLKTMLKTPSAWVLMIVMPLIFSIIFGGLSSNSEEHKPLVLLTVGNDDISVQAAELLAGNEQYQWKKASEDVAREEVKGQKAIAAINIPDGLKERVAGQEPLFNVIVQRESQEYLALYPFLEGAANTIINSYSIAANAGQDAFPLLLQQVTKQEGIKIEKEIIQKEGKNGEEISLLSLGFTIMFMMFGISGAASTILEEKAGGTWPRLLTTPATRWQIISGYIVSYFLMGWIQLGVLVGSISVLFDGKWGSPVWFIPFASLVILTIVGFGLMIAGLVKTKQQAGALSAVLIVSTSMLGGVYWPLDVVPDVMKLIANFVPQSWMMSGIREIVSGSMHGPTICAAVAALTGFSTLFYYFGLRRMKYDS